jgi:murein DD-endopeptidase MepM/ murein hydrolase activator NlpD
MPSIVPVPTLAPRNSPLPTLAPLPITVGPVNGTSQTTIRPGANVPAATPRPAGGSFIWPIGGPISSYFGPAHPLGIDVDLYGRQGAPIGAARAGRVTFAGGNPCCSYGYYVEMDHGDGFTTLYAHLNAPPPVRAGQVISQGGLIGYAGNTGNSTGVHLHFELRRNGVPLNPLFYLP